MHSHIRSRLSRRPSRRPKHGFTLIEVLVAIIFLHVGLLSLVAASAMLVRRMTGMRAEAAALEAATQRLEALAAGPCVASAGTAAGPLGLREEWSARLISPATLSVHDSVVFGTPFERRSVVLRTAITC